MICVLCDKPGKLKAIKGDHLFCMSCKGHRYRGEWIGRKAWDRMINSVDIGFMDGDRR